MSTISEHIFGLYNQLDDDEIQPIDETVVDDAIGVINKISVSDADSLFYFLAAMNLLNAAIKTAKHKSQLFYGFIKTRVSKITDLILQNPSFYTDTSVYYDDKQRFMYFEVYGVIFSFHQVQETKLIKNIASKNDRIQWTGIRLQRIAQNIFLYAKQLNIDSDKLSNDMDIQTTNNSNGNNNCLNAVNPNLFPCPDCGKEISVHAKICPQCGNDDPKTCDVVKRTCGYLGNPQARPMVHGRHKEISSRVKHMNGSVGALNDGNLIDSVEVDEAKSKYFAEK